MAPGSSRDAGRFGLANFKIIPISLMPLGVQIVPTDQRFGVYR
jgi:uncharacterized membrane protein YccF (DUF307 family)